MTPWLVAWVATVVAICQAVHITRLMRENRWLSHQLGRCTQLMEVLLAAQGSSETPDEDATPRVH